MILPLLLACASEPAAPPAPPPPTIPEQAPAPRTPEQGRSGYHVAPVFELVAAARAERRSILLVSLDTVRADRLAVYGGRAETPALDALAAQGIRFDQAVTHFPETCLSHWTIMSGVMPVLHGNAPAVGGSTWDGPTLAEIAVNEGYATAAFIGGTTLTDRSCGLSRGFQRYDDAFPFDPTDMKRPGAEVARLAVDWLRRQQGPTLTFVHFFDAHFPYTPDLPWDTRYDPDYRGDLSGRDVDLDPYRAGRARPSERDLAHVLALYDGELSEVDGYLAQVLAAAGSDTVVAVTADHGESFEHDYWFNHRDALWDGVMRVPLLIRAPGLPAGTTVAEQVGLVDLAPTLLELAGLPHDARMQGRSFASTSPDRPLAFAVTDPWRGAPQFAARTATHKLIERQDGRLAYDLVADPAETTPLPEPPADLGTARATYEALVGTPPQPAAPRRQLSPTEARQLESLGYLGD